MEHEKKLKFFFVAIILVVVLLTIFGITINVISNRHIAQRITIPLKAPMQNIERSTVWQTM